jgi:hypothetical protein
VVALDGESSGGRGRNEQSKGWDYVVVRGSENGERFIWRRPWARIRPRHAGRREETSGGRFSGAQHCEHGHHLVTGSVAGCAGPVTWPGR